MKHSSTNDLESETMLPDRSFWVRVEWAGGIFAGGYLGFMAIASTSAIWGVAIYLAALIFVFRYRPRDAARFPFLRATAIGRAGGCLATLALLHLVPTDMIVLLEVVPD